EISGPGVPIQAGQRSVIASLASDADSRRLHHGITARGNPDLRGTIGRDSAFCLSHGVGAASHRKNAPEKSIAGHGEGGGGGGRSAEQTVSDRSKPGQRDRWSGLCGNSDGETG